MEHYLHYLYFGYVLLLLFLVILSGAKMNLTYCGIILNIMVALLRCNRNSNEYEDLLVLQDIADQFDGSISADIDVLLKAFRDRTHLRVSIDDLYVYFSNMEVFKI